MLSFLHSADWQIGKPYARVQDPDKRARLRQVRIEAIARIGAQITPSKASLLLVAGDLFDSPTPSSKPVVNGTPNRPACSSCPKRTASRLLGAR